VSGVTLDKTDWMNARQLLTWLEDNKVASPLAFGADIAKLMRWVAMQKMVIQSPRSGKRYVIKQKVQDHEPGRRQVALFKVITKEVDPLIPPRRPL
jgi:hypothetical protein